MKQGIGSKFNKNIFPVLPCLFLIINFIIQFIYFSNSHLSSWSGGGFGMFANFDSSTSRRIIIKDSEQIKNHDLKDTDIRVISFKSNPSDRNLERMKESLRGLSSSSQIFLYAPKYHHKNYKMTKIYESQID